MVQVNEAPKQGVQVGQEKMAAARERRGAALPDRGLATAAPARAQTDPAKAHHPGSRGRRADAACRSTHRPAAQCSR